MVTFKRVMAQCFIWIVLLLIYLPILLLIVWSFNNSTVLGVWQTGDGINGSGFTGDVYLSLFRSREIGEALGNTVILAVTAGIVSTVLGTMGAVGAYYCKRRTVTIVESVNQIPVVNAEVIIAMSLTVMFVMVGNIIFKESIFSYWTLLIGHVVLAAPFVYLNVKPKLQQMDPALYEAALDLNATPTIAMRKVVIPQILPGILSGFMLAISLSLDDFIVTAFTSGPGLLSGHATIVTLSTYVQAKIKKGPVPPEMRALTTFIFLLVVGIAIGFTVYNNVRAKRGSAHRSKRERALARAEGRR